MTYGYKVLTLAVLFKMWSVNEDLFLGDWEALQTLSNTVDIKGRSFPEGVVIKWSDISINKEIGEGNFGKVYQGYVNMNEVQR